MSAKNLDSKGRFRSRTIGFRVSPEEEKLINSAVLNGKMAELNHLTAARITYAIGENSYAIDRATLQS